MPRLLDAPPPLKFLLADDHPSIRIGVRHMLTEVYHDATYGEAASAAQTLEMVRREPWSVVILDITMPGRSGLDILHELKDQQPATPVLILSMHAEEHFALRALKAGASGYVTKDSAPCELLLAVGRVLAGGRYLSGSLAEQLAGVLAGATQTPHERLSDREFQVMRMLASGIPLKEIGAQLSLSVNTISTYRMRVLEKMQLRTNAALVQYAIQHSLLE